MNKFIKEDENKNGDILKLKVSPVIKVIRNNIKEYSKKRGRNIKEVLGVIEGE